jgi:hypothetical protein
MLDTLRWMRETGRRERPSPDPLFARRLERDLMQAFTNSAAAPNSLRIAAPPPLDDIAPAEPTPLPGRKAVILPRWAWTQIAAAAILLFLLAGGALLVRYVTLERVPTQLSAVGEPTTETLIDANVEGAKDANTWTPLMVERWRFLPGSGTLSIPALDGPQWVVADSGPIVATVDGQGQTLAPGNGMVVPAGKTLVLRNPGLDETSVLRGVANSGFSLEDYDRNVITKEVALDTEAHESLPPGRSRIVFDRLTIPPGTTMKAEAATGQDWFDIDTGVLGLTLIGDSLPAGWQSGHEQELTVNDPIPLLVPGTSVSMHNIGQDPLVILRLRVIPLPNPAPASATVQPTG